MSLFCKIKLDFFNSVVCKMYILPFYSHNSHKGPCRQAGGAKEEYIGLPSPTCVLVRWCSRRGQGCFVTPQHDDIT